MTQQPQWNQSPMPQGEGAQPPSEQEFWAGRPYFDGQTPAPQDPTFGSGQGGHRPGGPANVYGQPGNSYPQAPVPYMPQIPQTSTSDLKGRLVRGLLINGGFVVVAMVMYVLNGRLPLLIVGVGAIGLVMTLVKYYQGRASIQGR